MTATQLRELVKGVVESHATHNTFYSIWSDVKDRETELTYPCAIWDQWRARLTEDEFGQLHRAILVRLLIVTVVATDRQPIARDTAVEAADNAAADYVLKIRQDYPDLVITNVSTTTQFDEYTQLETGVLLTMTVEGEGLCLDSDHFEPGIPGECVPGAVRNSDDTYTASVASGGTLTLPDVTHTDSDGSAVSTPAMVPFVATPCAVGGPATLLDSQGNVITTIPAGGSHTMSKVRIYNTIGDEVGAVEVTEDGLAPDAVVRVVNSANVVLSTMGVPSGVQNDALAPDASAQIRDSAGNNIGPATAIRSGAASNLTVPDSTITKPDGTTIGLRATQPLDVRTYRSGIEYALSEALWSGQVTAFQFGDEGTQYATLMYRAPVPVYKLHTATLGASWKLLANNNLHGNTNRYTDRSGGQTYADRIIQDHLFGLEWHVPAAPPAGNWATAIAAAVALNYGGNKDWRIPPQRILATVIDNQGATLLDYAPFNLSGVSIWTATTTPASTAAALPMAATGAFQSTNKAISTPVRIYCRRFV